MKKRNIITMVLLLLFTFGIYGIYWYCSFQNQIKKATGKGFSGVGHFFMTIITFGIYNLYWSYVVGGRIKELGGKDNGIIYLVLTLFGLSIVAWPLMQNEVNNIN